jgi:glutathione synthase/RimK-type ligase-like ATP-grasp enzyme
LGEDLAELSLRATEKIGLEYSGVDLLRSKVDGRAYIVELNSTPGWEGLQSVSEADVAGRLLDHIQGMLE